MRMKKDKINKYSVGIVVFVAIALIVVVAIHAILVFQMTSQQTMNVGELQMKNIKSELQENLSEAKSTLQQIAAEAELILATDGTGEALEQYFIAQKKQQYDKSNGICINVYIANEDWYIIPDFEAPEGFEATKRYWYVGAKENPQQVYITSPYMDAASDFICYTMSIVLSDKKTVVAIDFTLENVQKYIQEMCNDSSREAMIVTGDGAIVGYTDSSYVGGKLKDLLPEYNEILELEKNSASQITLKKEILGNKYTVFCSRTENDWYLIVSVNDKKLYKENYEQLAITAVVNVCLLLLIILLYLFNDKSKKQAQKALEIKDEFLSNMSSQFRVPLQSILSSSNTELIFQSDNPEEVLAKIREAGEQLSNMVDNLLSFSGMVNEEKKRKGTKENNKLSGMNRRMQLAIMLVLVITMLVSIVFNTSATSGWGNSKMEQEVNSYEYELAQWIAEQKSIMDVFCSNISSYPEILENYDQAVKYLNDITIQYPTISASYMTNPNAEHTVIMNNGWQPDEDWHVEERQWYIDTLQSEEGWSISAPYYDEQTGYYCLTLSERVYNAKTGEFLGNFGVDFYMDRLVEILGESYTHEGYAFLVDSEQNIVNHPNSRYEMTENSTCSINQTEYVSGGKDYHISNIKDYDGGYKICISKENKQSGFKIYVVKNWWSIYGNALVYNILLAIVFVICIYAVYVLMNKLLNWQKEINARLKEVAQEAVAAGKAKSLFLAQMSHEIRTPINAVLGMNEMILRESEDMDIREYALNIQSSGRMLLSLINSILDFSKIEDGKMEIIPEKYETAAMIHNLANMILERAKKKDLKLNLEISPTLPKVMYGDDTRIRQVITNLLTNAVKYTESGSITLKMEEEKLESNRILLHVAVLDTGIGIKAEDMGKLFESFQRIEEQRNRNIEGTGLGISIVQKLLNMMGSRLQVNSIYGEGSKFFFALEQEVVDETPIGDYKKRLEDNMGQDEKETYLFAPDASVLVVDDNELNLKVAKGLLKRNGIVPDTADSGAKCIEMVSDKLYDIVFLDHMMPGMDGIETLKFMKEHELIRKGMTVIALTANAVVGAKEEYLNIGFADYISKPIEVDALEDRLAKHLPKELISYKTVQKRQMQEAEEEAQEDGITVSELTQWYEKCPELHVLKGLEYCMGNKDFYLQMLGQYLQGNKEKELNEYYDKEDWENYRITVHALKSTSLTIGAVVFSEKAKAMELACKEENFTYIRVHHNEVMQEYQKLIGQLDKLVGVSNND